MNVWIMQEDILKLRKHSAQMDLNNAIIECYRFNWPIRLNASKILKESKGETEKLLAKNVNSH